MTPKEKVIAQIHHKETDFIPYTLFFEEDFNKDLEHGGMEHSGIKNGVLERVNTYYGGDSWRAKLDNHIEYLLIIKTGLEDKRVVDHESGKIFCTDMYGSTWRLDKLSPHLEKPALKKSSFNDYIFPDLGAFLDEGWYENSLKLINEKKDYFWVVLNPLGLWERTWTLRGFENALMDAVVNPDFYHELVRRVFEQQMMILDKVLRLPIDGFIFADDWGFQDGIVIGAKRWRRFFKPYVAKLYAKVHEAGKYVLHHMCGSIAEILPHLIDIGLDVYESVQPEAKNNNPYRLKKLYGENLTFWGGLGSQNTIPFGTPSDIKAEVGRLCKEMGKGGGYILECAKAIQPGTPVKNAIAVIEAFAEQAGVYI